MPLPTSGWSITRVIGRFTAAVRLLGCVDCLSRVRGDPYARFCGEGVVAILPPYPTSYGRSVGEVLLSDGRSLNQALVRAGLAWWYRQYAPHDTTLAQLEAEARAARRGLWADAAPVPPWAWRKVRGSR